MIGILDLQIGNLRSVSRGIYEMGFDSIIVDHASAFDDLTHLVIPGVGHFKAAVDELDRRQMRAPLRAFAASGRPMMGLCVGMQLLASQGLEGGVSAGLDLIPGTVEKLVDRPGFPIPQVGWNALVFDRKHAITDGIKENRDFYFVHSFHVSCENPGDLIAHTHYGVPVSAVIGRGNVVGCQFHPEKSQTNGLKILGNFCDWDGKC